MRAGRALRYAGGLALGIALFARAADRPSAEVRVLSGAGPQAPTTVTVRAEPETRTRPSTPLDHAGRRARERRSPAS